MLFLKRFLTLPLWQGLAGLAQMLAAVLTVVMVYQTRRMLRQADRARLASVAPEWEITNNANRLVGAEASLAEIDLQNVGLGPSRNFSVEFESRNGLHQNCIYMKSNERGANINTILVGDKLLIRLELSRDHGPLDGMLAVSCDSI